MQKTDDTYSFAKKTKKQDSEFFDITINYQSPPTSLLSDVPDKNDETSKDSLED